jgi:hypothetical protein
MDLNGSEFAGSSIKVFNKGIAGKVENVTISEVTKKKVDDVPNAPDYKVVFQDEDGANMNWSIYHFSPKDGATAEKIASSQKYYLQRIVALVRAVKGKEYEFPPVKDAKDAVNKLLKVVSQDAKEVAVNLFVTYGTTGYPNKKGYLGLRFFNFIEDADTTVKDSRLFAGKDDLMERVVDDLPKVNDALNFDNSAEASDDEDWLN